MCILQRIIVTQTFYSLSGHASCRKISWSLEPARFGFRHFWSLWNLKGISAAALPRGLSHFRTIRSSLHPIALLWDFTRFGGKTSTSFVNRDPSRTKTEGYWHWCIRFTSWGWRKGPYFADNFKHIFSKISFVFWSIFHRSQGPNKQQISMCSSIG